MIPFIAGSVVDLGAGMNRFWRIPRSKGGMALVLGLIFAALVTYGSIRAFFQANPAGEASRRRLFICAKTRKSFWFTVQEGTMIPVLSPYSHEATGYEAELCYWTAGGEIKADPTAVLLNSHLGRGEPTFCPDCGRLVVPLNPAPRVGDRPPPRREDFLQRNAGNGGHSR
jgi:hypothetical protein